MPLGLKNIRYRFKRLPSGRAVRIAFIGQHAIEVKPFKENKKGTLKTAGKAKRVK